MNQFILSRGTINPTMSGDIRELNEAIAGDLKNKEVIVTEKIRGIGVRFIIQKNSLKFFTRSGELNNKSPFYNSLFCMYKEKYNKSINGIYKYLKGNDLVLFFELVNNNQGIKYFFDESYEDIYLHDIYVNENWINWDDVHGLANMFELKTVPFIEYGKFKDIEYYKNFSLTATSNIATVSNQMMEGIVLKPYIEDSSSNTINRRLIAKVTHPIFFKPEIIKPVVEIKPGPTLFPGVLNTASTAVAVNGTNGAIVNRVSNGTMLTKASEYLDKGIEDLDVAIWKMYLEKKNIELKKENIKIILPVIVEYFINDDENRDGFKKMCEYNKLDNDRFVRAIKKLLPGKIRQRLGI